MNVVAARMHHAHFLAGVVLGFHFARVRQPGLFVNRKSVKLRAQQHGWPGAILHYRNYAVAGPFGVFVFADVLGDGVSQRPQLIGKERGSLFLVMRQLRRGMQSLVSCHERSNVAIDHGVERLLGGRRRFLPGT